MKYIYNRNQYNKYEIINELVDSDDINPEFGETLIGGTLHRLLGFVRSKVKETKMNGYSKRLDRLLASMLLAKVLDESGVGEGVADNVGVADEKDESTVNDIKKIVATPILLGAGKLYLDGKEKEAEKKLEEIPDEILSLMPKSSQEMVMVIRQHDEGSESDQEENQEEYKEIGDGKKEGEGVKMVGDGSDHAKNDIKSKIKEFDKKIIHVATLCRKCGADKNDRILKTMKRVKSNVARMKVDLEDNKLENIPATIKETEMAIEMIYKFCDNCSTDGKEENVKEQLIILESISSLFGGKAKKKEEERPEEEKSTTGYLTQKEFNKVRKDIEEASKNWKVTKEDLKKINDTAESKKVKVTEITAREGKELMGILTKAKNALLHTKPYDEIRKNQKRWYDKLDGSSRAVNRKGYQSWVKKVTELSSYYKDQVPDQVIVVMTDSLDKTNISNDYVQLTQEFLGLNKRGEKPGEYVNRYMDDSFVTDYEIGDTVTYRRTKKDKRGDFLTVTGEVMKIEGDFVYIHTEFTRRKNKKPNKIKKTQIIEISSHEDDSDISSGSKKESPSKGSPAKASPAKESPKEESDK